MKTANLIRLLAYHLVRLGVPGLLGLVMLVGAAAVITLNILPRNAELAGLDRKVASAAEELRRLEQGEGGTPVSYTPAESLALFYKDLPVESEIPAWLEKIYGIAAQENLALESGEYALVRAKSGHLNQYRISFPVKGGYPSIRRFISKVLATAPAIALESVSLKRESVGQGAVESRVVFLLYVEAGA